MKSTIEKNPGDEAKRMVGSISTRVLARAAEKLSATAAIVGTAVATFALLPTDALADPVAVSVPGNAESVPVFVAKERGYFEKRGLNIEVKVNRSSFAVPALQSGSVQINLMGTPSAVQAVDSGLSLVIVASGAVGSNTDVNYGIVTSRGSGVRTPADLKGKKLAVPGLEGFFHVLAREWLTIKGINPRDVTFVEAALPTSVDVLQAGTVDAVVTTEPFKSRIVNSSFGGNVFHIAEDLPDQMSIFLYVSTRKWAEANPGKIVAFKQAMDDAIAFVEADVEGARKDFGKYIQMPPEALAALKFNKMSTDVSPRQIGIWYDIMKRQNMLRHDVSPEKMFMK